MHHSSYRNGFEDDGSKFVVILALLGYHAVLIGSDRRFGTTEMSLTTNFDC